MAGKESDVAKRRRVATFAPELTMSFPSLIESIAGREAAWIVFSYILGCFTAGYYWTRWRTGGDIRELGSGNVGARNVGRTLGPWAFAVTLLLDAGKGAMAVAGARWIEAGPEATVAAIVAVVAGHNWPVQLRFRGGKGIAVSLGALLACEPMAAVALLAVFLPVIALLRNFTLAGMTAFALAPLLLLIAGTPKVELAAVSILSALILLTHRRNIRVELVRLGRTQTATGAAPGAMHKGSHDEA